MGRVEEGNKGELSGLAICCCIYVSHVVSLHISITPPPSYGKSNSKIGDRVAAAVTHPLISSAICLFLLVYEVPRSCRVLTEILSPWRTWKSYGSTLSKQGCQAKKTRRKYVRLVLAAVCLNYFLLWETRHNGHLALWAQSFNCIPRNQRFSVTYFETILHHSAHFIMGTWRVLMPNDHFPRRPKKLQPYEKRERKGWLSTKHEAWCGYSLLVFFTLRKPKVWPYIHLHWMVNGLFYGLVHKSS